MAKTDVRHLARGTIPALLLLLFSATALADGAAPFADRVVLYKNRHLLQLLQGETVLRSYTVALGRNPVGPKERAGDGRTPEGRYVLDRRNASSRYYRSIHISYPSAADRQAASARGVEPGGDIMIHGLPKGFEDLADCHHLRDWTRGCIALSNGQMDELWQMVPVGTTIVIYP